MSLISKKHLSLVIQSLKSLFNKKIKDSIKDSTADWSQNDASADNYVKNRTHWEETTEDVILPKTTVEGFALMQEPLYAVQNAFYFEPELNKTYTVTWDGIGYDVELKDFDGLACLGNENYVDMNGGGDIPFALIFAGNIFVVTESTEASHTISIITSETVVHKIDEKYLPKMASTPDWNQNDPEGEGYIKNRPFYEEAALVPFIEEQTITLNFADGYVYPVRAEGVYPTRGQTVRIVFDGVEYDVVMWEDGDACYRMDFTTIDGVYITVYDYGQMRADSADLDGDHTVAFYLADIVVTQIPARYLPDTVAYDADKMDKSNPTGTGSFSMNRKSGTTVGLYSYAEGYNGTSSADYSHAEGYYTTASGRYSHAEGHYTTAQGRSQHVSGEYNILSGTYVQKKTILGNNKSTNVGSGSTTYYAKKYSFDAETGQYTLIEPKLVGKLSGSGSNGQPDAAYSYLISGSTTSTNMYYNNASYGVFHSSDAIILDGNSGHVHYTSVLAATNAGGYLSIVGNGTSDAARSNAYTLDWEGNGWFAGNIKVGGTGQDDEEAKRLITENAAKEYTDIKTTALKEYVDTIRQYFLLIDSVNNCHYNIYLQNGNLCSSCRCTGIKITTLPDKYIYATNEIFDPTGMVVTAFYEDGSTKVIENYAYPTGALAAGSSSVIISYEEFGMTYQVGLMDAVLPDFEYVDNGDGTYTLTAWKETLNGEPSTELVVPEYDWILV